INLPQNLPSATNNGTPPTTIPIPPQPFQSQALAAENGGAGNIKSWATRTRSALPPRPTPAAHELQYFEVRAEKYHVIRDIMRALNVNMREVANLHLIQTSETYRHAERWCKLEVLVASAYVPELVRHMKKGLIQHLPNYSATKVLDPNAPKDFDLTLHNRVVKRIHFTSDRATSPVVKQIWAQILSDEMARLAALRVPPVPAIDTPPVVAATTPARKDAHKEVDGRWRGIWGNIKGLGLLGECAKLKWALSMLESHHFVALGEGWHNQLAALRNHPCYVGGSEMVEGRHAGGVVLLARVEVKALWTTVRTGKDWITAGTDTWSIGFVYLPPRSTPAFIHTTLTAIGDVDVLVGDLNVEMGPRRTDGTGVDRRKDLDKLEIFDEWMNRTMMSVISPEGMAIKRSSVATGLRQLRHLAHIDHIIALDRSKIAFSIIPKELIPFYKDTDATTKYTDHDILDIIIAPPSHVLYPPERGSERFRVGRLDDKKVAEQFRAAFRTLAPLLLALRNLVFVRARQAKTRAELQPILDLYDEALTAAVQEAARGTLGTYHASEVKKGDDPVGLQLEKEDGVVEALRLWKRSMRGRATAVVSEDPTKTPEEEVEEVWGEVFGSSLPEPETPDFGGTLLDELSAGPEGGFGAKQVRKALGKYPKSKSAGDDSLHARMLAELAYEVKRKRQPRRSDRANPPPFPSEIGSGDEDQTSSEHPLFNVADGRPNTTRRGSDPNLSHSLQFHLPTQPPPDSNLSANALPFVPHAKRPKAPKPPPEEFPFLYLFASLLQLARLTQLTPTRWGTSLVAMLSKLKSDDKSSPTASQLRPISLLRMFRRIFEVLLIPFLTDTNPKSWAFLHPNQAGFRKGWSCASALLAVDHYVRNGCPWAVHLDFKAAYPSPLPTTVIRELQKKGMPPSLLSIVWSLITTACVAILIVNGRTLSPLQVRKGFPQGGATSSILFDLYLDSLLYELEDSANGEGHGLYYADDGTLVAVSQIVAQRLLDVAYSWAQRMGMLFSIAKCFAIPPSSFDLHLVTLHIGGEKIPATRSTKYLGVIRTADGSDILEYTTRTTASMETTLRGLQAAGDSWRPMIRRHVLRMVCTSRIDYAAAFIHLWRLAKKTTDRTRLQVGTVDDKIAMKVLIKQENAAYTALKTHHKKALGWIIKNNSTKPKLAISMTAIPSYDDRLPLLAFGLALHIREASQYNVSRRLFQDPDLPTGPLDLIWRLRDDSILPDYDIECDIEIACGNPPVTRGEFVRRRVLRILSLPDGFALHTYIHPQSRTASLVDRVLDIQDPSSLRRALEWRKNVFGIHLKCPSCKSKFTRGHIPCITRYAPWRGPEGKLTPTELRGLRDSFAACVTDSQRAGDLMDFALGGGWSDEAEATLREWEMAMKWRWKVVLKRRTSFKVVLKKMDSFKVVLKV
ncbi:hypothetical protein P7C70_g3663, partial [Phenoliferia sp. Uapishka_3]